MDTTWVNQLNTLSELISDVSVKLEAFMLSDKVLLCVEHEQSDLNLCMRKSYRLIDETGYSSLDMYHFSINTYYRSLGAATKVIKELHKKNPYRITYLTHIQDKPLQDFLLRFGWQRDKDASFYCFTRLTP